MARMLQFVGLAVIGSMLMGCVSADKYTALKLERDRLADQFTEAQRESSQNKAAADAYKSQIDQLAANGNNSSALVINLNKQLSDAQAAYEEMNRRYLDAVGKVGAAGTALPQPLTNELNAFAAQNPDLVDFDSARGIVKFKSDVTFSTGDADLTPKAREVIDRFSAILNSPAANGYELMVAGHTDNTPVSNPATKAKGHKDNWYLSAHRAISVGDELIAQHVSPSRLGVAGYADQHPIAANTSEAGKAMNRRVEVLILPTTIHTGGGAAVVAGHTVTKTTGARHANKDSSADIDSRPVMSK